MLRIQSARRIIGIALLDVVLIAGVNASWAEEVTGEAVYSYCKSCHGERGAGGENGKYP